MQRRITSPSFQQHGNLSRLYEDATTWFLEHGSAFEHAETHTHDPGYVHIRISNAIGCLSNEEQNALIEQFMEEHDNSLQAQVVSLPGAKPEHLAPHLELINERGERIERPVRPTGIVESGGRRPIRD